MKRLGEDVCVSKKCEGKAAVLRWFEHIEKMREREITENDLSSRGGG